MPKPEYPVLQLVPPQPAPAKPDRIRDLLLLSIGLLVGMILVAGVILGLLLAYFFTTPTTIPTSGPVRPPVVRPGILVEGAHQEGLDLLQNKRYVEAEAKFRRVLEIEPIHAGANLNLGICLFHQNRFNESTMRFDQAIESTRDLQMRNAAWNYKGLIEWEKQNYEMAAWNFGKAVNLSPKDYTSLAFEGFMLDLAGHESEAQDIYRKVLNESPDSFLKDVVRQVQQGSKPPSTASNAGVGPGQ